MTKYQSCAITPAMDGGCHRSQGLPSPTDLPAYCIIEACGGGVPARAREGPAGEIHFIQLPSTSKGIATKQWFIRYLPAQEFSLVADPELDPLLIVERIAGL